MLNRLEKDFPDDPALLTSLGSVLLTGKQPAEALKRFERVVALKPAYAPYYLNAATALLDTNQAPEAAKYLEKALSIDPLLEPAVQLLGRVYQEQGEAEKARKLRADYEHAIGVSSR